MKQKLIPLIVGLYLTNLAISSTYAETASHQAQKKVGHCECIKKKKKKLPAAQHHANKVKPASIIIPAHNTTDEASAKNVIEGPEMLPKTGVDYIPYDVEVPGQSFVSTGPYIGVPLQYAGDDLIVNTPSVNQDVALLNLRKNIIQRLQSRGLKADDFHSHLLLSGVVEGQANYKNVATEYSSSVFGGKSSSDIDLTNAGLDAYILGPSTWTSGLISLRYDNNIGAQTGSLSINSKPQNSRVFIDKAFIVLGDFTQSPFYASFGQMYVPFGAYRSTMVSSPLTKALGRTQARAVVVGFRQQAQNAFYGAAYVFKGDSFVGDHSRINNTGVDLGFKFESSMINGQVGGGLISNIADSQGMQNTGNGAVYVPVRIPVFGGFGGTANTGNEELRHRVPAYNVRGIVSIGKAVDLIGEYIAATTLFNLADLTMNGKGAKPSALNLEAVYTFQSLAKPTSVSVGYGMTKDALALGLPAKRISAALNTSFWRNTLQSIEFRHDISYSKDDTSSGSGVPGPVVLGKSDNIVTAQFDLFF